MPPAFGIDGDVTGAEPAGQFVSVWLGREHDVDAGCGRGRSCRQGVSGECRVHERYVRVPGGWVVVVDRDVVGDAEDPNLRRRCVGRCQPGDPVGQRDGFD